MFSPSKRSLATFTTRISVGAYAANLVAYAPLCHEEERNNVKKWLQLGALAFVVGFGAIGCQKTAEGVEEDASKIGQEASQVAQKTGEAVKEGAKDASAALALTPKVKNAITADAALNDTRNLIDVDSADNVVHLKGHVISQALKDKAGAIAKKVIAESKATDTVSNELVVQP
jgi:osmotically-inducible protein OsmY